MATVFVLQFSLSSGPGESPERRVRGALVFVHGLAVASYGVFLVHAHDILAGTAPHLVPGSVRGFNEIVASTADKEIPPRKTVYLIVPGTPDQGILARSTVDPNRTIPETPKPSPSHSIARR